MERAERAERLKAYAEALPQAQKAFIEYLMTAYVTSGVEELGTKRLPQLLADGSSMKKHLRIFEDMVEKMKSIFNLR